MCKETESDDIKLAHPLEDWSGTTMYRLVRLSWYHDVPLSLKPANVSTPPPQAVAMWRFDFLQTLIDHKAEPIPD